MDLADTPEMQAFREEVRKFVKEHKGNFPHRVALELPTPEIIEWQKLLIKHGYAARTIPQEYGGAGKRLDQMEFRIIVEEFIAGAAPLGLANQGISMLVPTLLELGTEEQKQNYIRATITGEMIWCQGYSEPGAGSDLASLQTRAVEDGDDFIINGQKIWTSGAASADMMFCLVRTEPDAPRHAGISYLVFPMNLAGIEVRPLKTMTGHAEFNEVYFSDVRVPRSSVVGRRGEGWLVANVTLRHERGMLGDPNQAERRLVSLVELMRSEKRDGRPLIADPVFRGRLARLQARVYAMKAHGLRLLTLRARKQSAGLAGMIVKLEGCEINHRLSELAIDALGADGLLYHGDSEERLRGYWQRSFMFDLGLIIGGGTAQIQKNIIAERGLGLPRRPVRAA